MGNGIMKVETKETVGGVEKTTSILTVEIKTKDVRKIAHKAFWTQCWWLLIIGAIVGWGIRYLTE